MYEITVHYDFNSFGIYIYLKGQNKGLSRKILRNFSKKYLDVLYE
jgi:flagellar motor switch protein FliG